eukprot:scaffold876_cov243-Pinguiococcus_pyrenoidosus.AAC.4
MAMKQAQLVVSPFSVLVGVAIAAGGGNKLPQALPWLVASSAWFALCLFQLFATASKVSEDAQVRAPDAQAERHGLEKYEHKVGGHTSPDGLDVCLLHHNQDEVLKRLQPQPYTLRELAFYGREMPEHQEGLLQPVMRYLPQFYGVHDIDSMSYLRLQNLMRQYSKPCILDVKVGRRCYEVSAPEDKKDRERQKYPYQETVGYRVAGLKVWDAERGAFFEEIRQGKNRTEADMLRGKDVETYLAGCSSTEQKLEVTRQLDEHLAKLEQFLAQQTYFEFCAVSLLFAYEGDPQVAPQHRVAPFVWLVDFAHTIAGCSAVDDNFLFGLRMFRTVMAGVRQRLEHAN